MVGRQAIDVGMGRFGDVLLNGSLPDDITTRKANSYPYETAITFVLGRLVLYDSVVGATSLAATHAMPSASLVSLVPS